MDKHHHYLALAPANNNMKGHNHIKNNNTRSQEALDQSLIYDSCTSLVPSTTTANTNNACNSNNPSTNSAVKKA